MKYLTLKNKKIKPERIIIFLNCMSSSLNTLKKKKEKKVSSKVFKKNNHKGIKST